MIVHYLKLYLCTLVAFLVIDLAWLGVMTRTFYNKHIGYLMRPNPYWAVALAFYLLFVLGILVFVVMPGLKAESLPKTILLGVLFGLMTYGTYDLTNWALVKEWPWIVSVVDLCWGMFVAAVVGIVGYLCGRWLT
ncbi:MAG: DUF2177 family protein [Sedimentisphaerales bacterium]|nr:DUF2177 family protein [Sedimentisphaerales bacterium]